MTSLATAILAASELSDSDVNLIILILAVLILCVAAYCGYLRNIPGAAICAAIGVILLILAL